MLGGAGLRPVWPDVISVIIVVCRLHDGVGRVEILPVGHSDPYSLYEIWGWPFQENFILKSRVDVFVHQT